MAKGERTSMDISGTLIRGAEGALYFVPDEDLEAFRVPDAQAKDVKKELDAGPKATKGMQLAIKGPFARGDLIASPSDPTVLVAASVRMFLEKLRRQ
ncbi:MAG: hypothetical protein DMF91_13290 [Acidobacteria bacterium]|nr:MAG: hypothetical protein DMF91_13290 [Acidobacteriota bacterium]